MPPDVHLDILRSLLEGSVEMRYQDPKIEKAGARQAGRFNVVLWRDSVREAIAKVYIPEEDAQK